VRTVPAEAVPENSVIEVSAARSYLTRLDGELIALSQKCTHLGCKVPFCDSSGQFECPCHGTTFNRVGEYRTGPAPRGMDRHPVEVGADGLVYIDTGTIDPGPAPGSGVDRRAAARPVVRHGGPLMPYAYQTDEELEASTNRWMLVGVVLLALMAAVFPFYRWYEPSARSRGQGGAGDRARRRGRSIWQTSCARATG
jgi:nitrite reductase/ring-hydroxylating ferredoxin subunit